MVNIGIIGCGKIATTFHIPQYKCNKNANLYGFYNRSYNKSLLLANEYCGNAYASAEQLILDKNIDAVSICTPNSLHSELAIKALNAGKHVLCEKPVVTDAFQLEKLLAAYKNSNKQLCVNHCLRTDSKSILAKNLLLNGEIGELLTFKATLAHAGPENWSPGASWFFDKNSAVLGVLSDLGVHKIDALRFITNRDFVSAYAQLSVLNKVCENGKKIPLEDNAVCVLELEGGAVGTVDVSWTNAVGENTLRLCGTKGSIIINEQPYVLLIKNDGESIRIPAESRNLNAIDVFIDSIMRNSKCCLSAEYAVNTMQTVFACYNSAANKCKVII